MNLDYLKKLGTRAAITFVQVAITVFIATGVLDLQATTAELALMTGAGAALSVIYNALTIWLDVNKATSVIYRAIVTFFQVLIPVVTAGGVLDLSVSTWQVGWMSGIGAVLSLILNASTEYLAKSEL